MQAYPYREQANGFDRIVDDDLLSAYVKAPGFYGFGYVTSINRTKQCAAFASLTDYDHRKLANFADKRLCRFAFFGILRKQKLFLFLKGFTVGFGCPYCFFPWQQKVTGIARTHGNNVADIAQLLNSLHQYNIHLKTPTSCLVVVQIFYEYAAIRLLCQVPP